MHGRWRCCGSTSLARARAHAYLITGPRGVGRRTLGLRFAQALNCTNPVSAGVPCGSCDDCKRIEAHKHPDLNIIEAEVEGGTLKVEQVRELRRLIVLRPFQARYRVAMLLRFQEANDAAGNALLKTLEEAPSYAVLILTAESSEGLLPTIVSRCEVLRLHPVALESIQHLLERKGADQDRARLLAHISEGRPGVALGMLADPGSLAYRDERLNDLLGFDTLHAGAEVRLRGEAQPRQGRHAPRAHDLALVLARRALARRGLRSRHRQCGSPA